MGIYYHDFKQLVYIDARAGIGSNKLKIKLLLESQEDLA